MRKILSFLLVLLVAATLNAAPAIEETYKKLFDGKTGNDQIKAMFVPDFLKVVPEKEIVRILDVYRTTLGSFQGIDLSKKPMQLQFEKGTAPTTIGFDSNGLINTLWFGAPELTQDDLETVLALFKKIQGKVSICLIRNDKDILIDIDSGVPMAIGSSFKLYILKALEQQVKDGKRNWNDLVKIDDSAKSFPSGILQDWPAGMTMTLESMAALMISLSDNTATDHLFNLLGRETLAGFFPETCQPPFNTFDMFKLKIFYPEKGKAFAKADKAGRLAILDELAGVTVAQIASAAQIYDWKSPILIDQLEWLISTRELCSAIYQLRHLKILGINPATGLVDPKEWAMVGFKGGSEPGVLNYTWVLQLKDDENIYCLSCTANDPVDPVNDADFNMAVTRLLKLISQKKAGVH
ncbi:MAG: serine hydrolase [Candidatus Rifleibacteriota bacterium]